MSEQQLTVTDVRVAATEILLGAAYTQVPLGATKVLSALDFLFEDDYGIVGLAVYETWKDLAASWTVAQQELVAILATHLSRDNMKAWDVYLVILTPEHAGREGQLEATAIRYDTSSVRKLVGVGEHLRRRTDVTRVLMALLPFPSAVPSARDAVLDTLPQIFQRQGRQAEPIRRLVEAWRRQEDLFEALQHSIEETP